MLKVGDKVVIKRTHNLSDYYRATIGKKGTIVETIEREFKGMVSYQYKIQIPELINKMKNNNIFIFKENEICLQVDNSSLKEFQAILNKKILEIKQTLLLAEGLALEVEYDSKVADLVSKITKQEAYSHLITDDIKSIEELKYKYSKLKQD